MNGMMNTVNCITQFTHFSEDDLCHLSEEEIICGFKLKNPQIIKKYFYGFCQKAYFTWNKKYQFEGKEGLDFYTLSNDYYLRMATSDWKSLEVERKRASLSTWVVGNFWYTILDALKAYNEQQALRLKFVSKDNYSSEIDNMPDCSYKGERFDWTEIQEKVLVDNINRIIFDRYILQGEKMKNIANELNMTSSAVSQRYKDIVKSIANYYRKDNYGKRV